ncbi:MAG: HAD family hydrolase [Candidatus Heimdallarchaeota archaeon]
MINSQFKMILLDIDGTLLNYRVDWEKMRKNLRQFFLENYGIDEYFKPVLQKIDHSLLYLHEKKNYSANEISQARKQAFLIVKDADLEGAHSSVAIQGSHEAIHFLRGKGMKISIFTRNEAESTHIALEKCGFRQDWFACISCRNKDKHPVKPDPYQIQVLLRKFGLEPTELLVVGDHPYDMQAATKAGSPAIGVLTGIADKKTLLEAGASDVIDSICFLPEWLGFTDRAM